MRLFYGVLSLLMLGLTVSYAGVAAPVNQQGTPLDTLDFVGADTCRVTISTGTNAILCSSGQGQVYGVVFSSTAATNYLVARDTGTANSTSTPLVNAWADDTGARDGDGFVLWTPPVPIKFENGLSVNMNSALTGVGEAVVVYRKRQSTD